MWSVTTSPVNDSHRFAVDSGGWPGTLSLSTAGVVDQQPVSFWPRRAGTYVVELAVTDSDGNSASDTVSITVVGFSEITTGGAGTPGPRRDIRSLDIEPVLGSLGAAAGREGHIWFAYGTDWVHLPVECGTFANPRVDGTAVTHGGLGWDMRFILAFEDHRIGRIDLDGTCTNRNVSGPLPSGNPKVFGLARNHVNGDVWISTESDITVLPSVSGVIADAVSGHNYFDSRGNDNSYWALALAHPDSTDIREIFISEDGPQYFRTDVADFVAQETARSLTGNSDPIVYMLRGVKAAGQNEMWFATDGSGLFRLPDIESTTGAERFNDAMGTTIESFAQLALDNAGGGDIWAASNAGLIRYKRDVEELVLLLRNEDGASSWVAARGSTGSTPPRRRPRNLAPKPGIDPMLMPMPGPKPKGSPRRSKKVDPFAALVSSLEGLVAGERVDLGGLVGSGPAWLLARLASPGTSSAHLRGPSLIVCASEAMADRFAADLSFFLEAVSSDPPAPGVPAAEATPDRGIVRLPADERLPYEDGSADRGTQMARMAALDRLRRGDLRALIVSAKALSQKLPPPTVSDRHGLTLRVGQAISRTDLVQRLTSAGYRNAPLVEDPGSFAQRGGIVDLWSMRHDQPIRIEIFGDEIDTIRAFDPETQRTQAPIDHAEVSPAHEILFSPETIRRATSGVRELAGELGLPTRGVRRIVDEIEREQTGLGIEAFLPAFYEGGLVPLSGWLEGFDLLFLVDPAACDARLFELWAKAGALHDEARARGEPVFPPEAHFLDPDQALESFSRFRRLDVHELLIEAPSRKAIRFGLLALDDLRRPAPSFSDEGGTLGPLVRKLSSWKKKGRTVALACGGPGQADRLRRLLEGRDLSVHPATFRLDLEKPGSLGPSLVDLHLLIGELSEGIEDPETGLVIVSEADLLGKRPPRRHDRAPRRSAEEVFTTSFQDLSEGDLVVHVEHGIGRYRGLTRLSIRGVAGDFLLIEYAGKDKIYLPIYRLGLVQRYVGAEAEGVRLDKLGGQSFALRKKRVKDELIKMAAELLDIYAARKAHPGTSFGPPDEMFREFEASFPFDETEDQARAIDEVLADMQRPEPMDRLVCGDVGYGKTEVAMRAAMKAVQDGKQVAVLVPTTVLAAQHEATFKERFAGLPVIVDSVSRLRRPEDVKEILLRASEGKVDVLIGTHRLLSRDMRFRDLGLLVIDEEQRFGVAQKERLKKLRRQIDVMTMTATPIPRTLHMSLSGMRDLSIIATAPADRRSIRTFVSRFEGETIKEAVSREIARGGQVFFVHNRVRSIGAMGKYLEELLPDARIVIAHGQMSERALERAMARFASREADVLLSSAIIESGLDMPTVNTILVNRADTFGLAQLYQLRGRVGRSRERAYCYLLVPARRPISPDAKKRLAALQQLTELGSGLRLASHDMEIRGAGNLLGKEQSGQVAAVGFDLYADLLEEAVRELKGEPPREHLEPEVILPVAAYLPEDYVPDVHQRLILYKRLTGARRWEDLEDLRVEIIDRYGQLPVEADQLIRIRGLCQGLAALGMAALEAGPGRLISSPGPSPKVDLGRLLAQGGPYEGLKTTPEGKIVMRLPTPNPDQGELLDQADALVALLSRTGGEPGESSSPRRRRPRRSKTSPGRV